MENKYNQGKNQLPSSISAALLPETRVFKTIKTKNSSTMI